MRKLQNVICYVLLVVLINSTNCVKLRERRSTAKLKIKGVNVCEYDETKTIWEIKSTKITETQDKEVCCRHWIGCWRKCKRTSVLEKSVTKKVSRLQNYKALYCCPGWSVGPSGEECTIPVCFPPCRNNGTCTKPDVCQCQTGFEGRVCQLDIDECLPGKAGSKCTQSCVNTPGSYYCACQKGYIPENEESTKCKDINECKKSIDPCKCAPDIKDCKLKKIAQCYNTKGSYQCKCAYGYRLARDNMCVDRNECFENNDCTQACVNTIGAHNCTCFPGFELNKAKNTCQQKEFCKYSGGCEHICQPIYAGRLCLCRSGYFLAPNRQSCIDIDECKLSNPCDPQRSTCENFKGGYRCVCKSGYRIAYNGFLCLDRNECEENTAMCEQKCINTEGGYQCACNSGFKLGANGITCQDIDECQAKGRTYCAQKCINTIGSFVCACDQGFLLGADKRTCYARKCEPVIDPFYGKASCEGYIVGKKCQFFCSSGFDIKGPSERTCQPNGKWSGVPTQCIPKKCGNPIPPINGKVTLPCDLSFGSTCPVTCLDGHILRGDQVMKCGFVYNRIKWDKRNIKCEEILVCKPNPCQHGGKCSIVTDTEYSCDCTNTGHVGQSCTKLLVEVSPIPKLQVDVASPLLKMTSSPAKTAVVTMYPEEPDVSFSPSNLTFSRSDNERFYTLSSITPGLFWATYAVKAGEPVQSLKDKLLFFYQNNAGSAQNQDLLSYDKKCYLLNIETHSCAARSLQLSSTNIWKERHAGLFSTTGMMFINLGHLNFPVALPKVNSIQLLQDITPHGTLTKGSSTQSTCLDQTPTELVIQNAVLRDLFPKTFISQFNKLTPSWFSLELKQGMQNIDEDNIRTYIWSAQRVREHAVCGAAAIDETSTYLVYLHHESITMKAHEKSVSMTTKSKFCLLIDMCKLEPHFALPHDNLGHLETMFSFTTLQTMGWKISLKSIGFRSGITGDIRKCSKPGVNQAIFGSAAMTYDYKNTVKGEIHGLLTYDLIHENGKEVLKSSSQCFDGKSRIDALAWYTADTSQRKYVKQKTPHNQIKTKTSQPTRKQHMLRVIQGRNSVFKMKSGLKPILVKSPKSNAYLDFIFKEVKSSGGSSGGTSVNSAGVELLEFPVQDLEMYLGELTGSASQEPLKSTAERFLMVVTDWNVKLTSQLNGIFGDKSDDASFVLQAIQYNYYKVGPAISTLKTIILGIKTDSGVDSSLVDSLKYVLTDLETAFIELKKHMVVKTPTKEFAYLAAHFNSSLCLYSPCVDDVKITMYPFSYDLGLGTLCRDNTKGNFDIWQTQGLITKNKKVGEFFHFQSGDILNLCLTIYGVKTAKIKAGIELFGSINRKTFNLVNDKISIPERKMSLYGAFDFTVNSTVDLSLKSWEMISIKTYGIATSGSKIKRDMQKNFETYTLTEFDKIEKRVKDSGITESKLTTSIAQYEHDERTNLTLVRNYTKEFAKAEQSYRDVKKKEAFWRKKYDENRAKMLNIEREMNKNCTLQTCQRTCHKLKKCVVCQDPYNTYISVPFCKSVVEDRSYGFLKSEKSVCSHIVTDRRVKYTGNCEKPGPDPATAKIIVDRINDKIEKKQPLTLADAIDLEYINEKQGRKLREQIEKQNFFKFLPVRLKNNLLTEVDFQKLESYTGNKTFADEMRRKMKLIANSKTVHTIVQKLKDGQTLTEEDYMTLRKINPQMEKQIRKSEVVSEIMEKIRLLGNITEKDIRTLKEVAPELAKNLTQMLQNQDVAKTMLDKILKKMANGSLGPEDIAALEKVNPSVAKKLKAALKEQLSQKVKEIKSKLDSVKKNVDIGLNNTGFKDMQSQLNILSGSMKEYDRDALRKLQEKIRANNKTNGSLFQEAFERLDLGYDIKKLTGNSKDIYRVLDEFFAVLPKFDLPQMLQRSERGALEGLNFVQDWFKMSSKIVQQACTRRNENETSSTLGEVVDLLKDNLKNFEDNVCKKKWTVGVRTKTIETVCNFISSILKNIDNGASSCDLIESKIVGPISTLVEEWKMIRIDIEKMKKEQWQKSETTLKLFTYQRSFINSLTSAFATELGSVQLKFITTADIVAKVQKNLAGKKKSTNLAELDAGQTIFEDIIQAVEKLPNLIKQNGQTAISVGTSDSQTISKSLEQILNLLVPLLQDVCEDKKPKSVTTLTKLIAATKKQFSVILMVKDIDKLLLQTQRFNQYAKYVILTLNKDRNNLEGCQLVQDLQKNKNNTWTELALVGLKTFLETVKPLEGKTIKDLANDIKTLIREYSSDGLGSPIGQLMDLAEDFVEESPNFNLPVIVSFSPKVSTIALNTFKDYLSSALDIFNGMKSILDKCKDDKCNPDEVFGKGRLSDVFGKLESYIEPISTYTNKYMKKFKQFPKGLKMLATTLEEIRVAFKRFSESGTGFSPDGLSDIISAFEDAAVGIDIVKKNLKTNFEQLAGLKNGNIKNLMTYLTNLRKACSELYQVSKIASIKKKIEGLDTILNDLKEFSIAEETSPLIRRLQIILMAKEVIESFGEELSSLYNSRLPENVIYHVDKTFAVSVGSVLENVKTILEKLLKETFDIGDEIGAYLPSFNIIDVRFSAKINAIVSSVGTRKTDLAKRFAAEAKKVTKFFNDITETAREKFEDFMGIVEKYKDQYKELKKKLQKYGDMFDEVEDAIKNIKKGPVSKIGEIKDATDDLIDSLKSYDLSLILTADPKTIPNKITEMKQLFSSLSETFKEIDNILQNCSTCNVEKIFGYRFLKDSAIKIEGAFTYMFGKVEKLGNKVGNTIKEVQDVNKVVKEMQNRFKTIKESKEFTLKTLKDLSEALQESTVNITSIQTHAENIGKILLGRDVDLQIIGGNINKLVKLFSNTVNKTYQIGQQGKKVLDKAKDMKQKFEDLKKATTGIKEGPLGSRLEIAKSLAEDSKDLLNDLPELLKSSKETLEKAGIDSKWMADVSRSLEKVSSSLVNVLDKTGQILEAADITVTGIEKIRDRLPSVSKSWKEIADSSWDKKIPSIQSAFKNLEGIFDEVIGTSIKGAAALNYTLNKNDLKSALETVVGKERLQKFQNLFGNVSRMMNQLQKGPVSQIGKLTDSVDNFIDALDGYDFSKMLLQNPSDVRNRFNEFHELVTITGGILKDIGKIAGDCKACDLSPIFGKRFISSFSNRLKNRFENISTTFQKIGSRVDTGLQGWETVISTVNKLSGNFKNINKGSFSKQSFDDISDALSKSAVDIMKLKNGTSDIFKAIFDGDNEMNGLKLGFEKLVQQTSGILNRSAIVLPKVGTVYETVTSVKDLFDGILDDADNVGKGPIESRIDVLKKIGKGIDGIGKSLPLIFNQSADVLTALGVNSGWFRRFSGSMVNVTQSLSNVVNKTNILLDGAGLVVKEVRNVQGLTRGIQDDYHRMLKAPWNQKFNILNEALGKADKIVGSVSNSAEIFDETINNVTGVDLDVNGNLKDLTNGMSGFIGNISEAVKKLSVITKDITTTIDQIKSGPIQKIGKLTDSTKEFVDKIKNYDIADIMLMSPKFAKEKFGDLKEIFSESGGILKNISQLLDKHCKSCGFNKIFGKDFSSGVVGRIGSSLKNISIKVEKVLNKVDKGATSAAGIIKSVQGIKGEIAKLDEISFDEDGFDKIADVLSTSSEFIQDIKNDSSNIFQLLFNGNDDLLKVSKRFERFVDDFGSFVESAGNFSSGVADAIGEVKKIKETFRNTIDNFDDLTQGPIENRVEAVKNIANGINSMMKAFPDLLKTSPISPKWLRGFGTKLEGVTSGISEILNKTSDIAEGVGETVQNVQAIGDTASIIGNEFKRLLGSGSIGGKLQIANNIVSKVKTLTSQINVAVNNATEVFEKLTGKTIAKTNIFGKDTSKILDSISSGIETVADRYAKFTELSKSLNDAFDRLDDDPVKFALEDLPVIFNQTSNFVSLLYKDIQGVAGKIGIDLGEFNLDGKLVQSAKSFFKFTQTTLKAVNSGKQLINDFKALVNSKNFKNALLNFDKVLSSGDNFLTSMDKLGETLFKNWGNIKGELTSTLNDVSKSIGINLKELGSTLQKGLAVGKGVLNIAANIESLLNMKEFNAETIAQAANSIVSIAQSSVDIAKQFGYDSQIPGLENAAEVLGTVTAVINIYRGVKLFIDWLDGACDLTWKAYSVDRKINYVCLMPKLQVENVKILIENCVAMNKTVIRGYGEGKICCPTEECVYMQSPQCLYNNERCRTTRQAYLERSKIIDQRSRNIFINYTFSSQAAISSEADINIARIKLNRATIRLNRTKAGLARNRKTLEMLRQAKDPLQQQYRKKHLILRGKRVMLLIEKVEFQVTQYKSTIRHLPLKITWSDKNGHLSYIDIAIDSQKMKESFDAISRAILKEEVNYVPIPGTRRRRSLAGSPNVFEEKRNASYWSQTCAEFTESFELIKTIVMKLDGEVVTMSAKSSDASPKISPNVEYGKAAHKQSILLKELELSNLQSTESPVETMQRWKRTSEAIMMENIGAVCIKFDDCLEKQLETMKSPYEPTMKGYEEARNSIDTLHSKIISLLQPTLTKKQAQTTLNNIKTAVKAIEKNTYFCDSHPVLSKQMPLSRFAYEGVYFELECSIDGPAGMEYSWRKNNTILPQQNDWTLRLTKISKFDHGYYTCHGHTVTSDLASNKVLVRVVKPITFLEQPKDIVLRYPGGSEVNMVCNATTSNEPEFKWWFRPYTSTKKQQVSATSILKIKPVRRKNIGHYWCEITNGQDSVASRKAKLDIVRVLERRETARIRMSLSTASQQWRCQLPKPESSQTMTAMFKAQFKGLFGASSTNTLKLTYKWNDAIGSKGTFNVEFGVQDKKSTSTDKIGFALQLSKERAELHTKVNKFVEEMEKSDGVDVMLNECNYTTRTMKYAVDWQAEELACPAGMGASSDVVYCVQCTPGTFDSGDGKCSPCPRGTYQPSAGQTKCIACGIGYLTTDEGATNYQECISTDFVCKEPLDLVLLLDSSNSVDASTWSRIKWFVSNYVQRMDSTVVDIETVIFGDYARLVDPDELQVMSRISGDKRLEDALGLAKKSLDTSTNIARKVVLTITSHDGNPFDKFEEEGLQSQVKSMQTSGIEMYTMVINGNSGKNTAHSFNKITSKPLGRYLFTSKSSNLSRWSTVMARSTCRAN